VPVENSIGAAWRPFANVYALTVQGDERIGGVFRGGDDGSAITGGMFVRYTLATVLSPRHRWIRAPARLRRAPFVSMVETADLRDRHDAPCGRWRDRTRQGSVLLERQVRARRGVVLDVSLQHAPQPDRIHNDHVIEAFSSNGPDEPFDIGILPG
jgi:hypothetical protein